MTRSLSTKTDTHLAPTPELTWGQLVLQCAEILKTGFLPKAITTPQQAAAIVLKGRELGIGTMLALESINVIQGKTTMSGQLMLATAYRTGLVESLEVKNEPTRCVVTLKRKGDAKAYVTQFGAAEAMAMGLSSKDNYKKQKGVMYKWRALSDALRTKFPDALGGVYTPEELGATVRVVGDTLEVESIPAETQLPADNTVEGAEKPSGSDREISEKELKYLHAKMNEFQISEDDQKKYVMEQFKKNSRKLLTLAEMTQMVNHFDSLTMPPGVGE